MASSPWKSDSSAPFSVPAQERHTFHLRPFQVLTLDLAPGKDSR
jgi:hypothetical protein